MKYLKSVLTQSDGVFGFDILSLPMMLIDLVNRYTIDSDDGSEPVVLDCLELIDLLESGEEIKGIRKFDGSYLTVPLCKDEALMDDFFVFDYMKYSDERVDSVSLNKSDVAYTKEDGIGHSKRRNLEVFSIGKIMFDWLKSDDIVLSRFNNKIVESFGNIDINSESGSVTFLSNGVKFFYKIKDVSKFNRFCVKYKMLMH